jgi:hypothetical protein
VTNDNGVRDDDSFPVDWTERDFALIQTLQRKLIWAERLTKPKEGFDHLSHFDAFAVAT